MAWLNAHTNSEDQVYIHVLGIRPFCFSSTSVIKSVLAKSKDCTIICLLGCACQPGPLQVGINSFPASGDFLCLLITFANSLDPGQARQRVMSDLDPNCLTLC